MNDKYYCVFILTHGRPDNCYTYKTLIKCGYTGKIYFVVDNEDKCIEQYQNNFGKENVKVFNKKLMADKIDEANNFDNRKVIVHARNYCFKLAKELGYKYFIQLDDDYYEIDYKFPKTKGLVIPKKLDSIFDSMFEYYKKIPALTIAFAQNGDFIGGIDNGKDLYRFNKRKCMNSFFCSTDKPFNFVGSINEDVNTYTTLAARGNLFLTIPVIAIVQKDSQTQKQGMADSYKNGTYIKSYTTVLMQPSSVKVSMMNAKHKRIHHSIKWVNTTPMIIDEKYKK
jgi:hypothetical protein